MRPTEATSRLKEALNVVMGKLDDGRWMIKDMRAALSVLVAQ
jgi:hypothetical protein